MQLITLELLLVAQAKNLNYITNLINSIKQHIDNGIFSIKMLNIDITALNKLYKCVINVYFRNKIMEYYSKLNMEVEKSKMHTEWKIRRLQLDQSRIQLLSTEERNLKREKLELEHQKNEEIMAMSIQSLDTKSEEELDSIEDTIDDNISENKFTESSSSVVRVEQEDTEVHNLEYEKKYTRIQKSNVVFSSVCNLAKSLFGVSKSNEDRKCDNKKELDSQGNIVNTEFNYNNTMKSSDVIGSNLDNDNSEYRKVRQDALLNKQKVMAHEFGQLDKENNQIKDSLIINFASVDIENNMQDNWTPFREAKRNKMKVLGADFNTNQELKPIVVEPRTDAKKEAILNKQKVLGVEYNLPVVELAQKEPANVAQKEAVINKKRVLNSEFELGNVSPKRETAKRSGLTLNLKPYLETSVSHNFGSTPNTGATTPGDLFPRVCNVVIIC